jgi:YD repeat-containing protein
MIIYVNLNASGGGDGTNWTNAYEHLQGALAAAINGDEIWVAQGTYIPGNVGNRTSTFQLISGVALYGGFDGNETSREQRNWQVNVTNLSGDLNGDDSPGFTNRSDNVYNVLNGSGTDSSTILDGFTVVGGYANGATDSQKRGGGVYLNAGDLIIRNCNFLENWASVAGGGVHANNNSCIDLTNCYFAENGSDIGGGFRIYQSTATVVDCNFTDNESESDGGGIAILESTLILSDSEFNNNYAQDKGGALHNIDNDGSVENCCFVNNYSNDRGGAIYNELINFKFQNCFLSNNKAVNIGGAILNRDHSCPEFVNCLFVENESVTSGGGAVYNDGENNDSKFTNCTFVKNKAKGNGGGIRNDYADPIITNCIFWNNIDNDGQSQDEKAQVYGGSPIANYSCIQGGWSRSGGNYISTNPCFIDINDPNGPDNILGTLDDGLRLDVNSPCIDMADSSVANFPGLDFLDLTRVDIAEISNYGNGTPDYGDIGAYETYTGYSADADGDGMADDWEQFYGLSSASGDQDNDGATNLQEYQQQTSPITQDTDDDGMLDGWEILYFLNPLSNEASGDADNDGITNGQEYSLGSDPSPPLPNPPEWAVAPYSMGPKSIKMVAVEASDPTGVEYYFECTYGNGHDSGWQITPVYTDTGLSEQSTYQYRVILRDGDGNLTSYSNTLGATTMAEPDGSAKTISGEFGSDLNLRVDPFTGGVNYTLPIIVPPGRQGSEPKLNLSYSSGGSRSWCGTGWSIGMGVIQRDGRYGVPVDYDDPNDAYPGQYDDDKGFVASLGSVGSRLVLVDEVNDVYRAETDQAFLKYIFDKDNNQWLVIDKSGNKYYFGETSQGRMAHPDFAGGLGSDTFLWALERILDKNGNQTIIDYTSNSGQIYLSKISYNGNINSPAIDETHTIEFILEDRKDVSISYATGYRIETKKRLSEIHVKVDDNWVRRYDLDYTYSISTTRSLLTSVTMYGSDNLTPLPPITFEYQELAFEFDDLQDWGPLNSPGISTSWNSPHGVDIYGIGSLCAMLDINGDGLPDRVMRDDSDFTTFKVQLNTGAGFEEEMIDWGELYSPVSPDRKPWKVPYGTNAGTCSTLLDIDGDGLTDRVMRESVIEPEGGWNKFVVQLNDGNSFGAATDWTGLEAPETYRAWFNPHGKYYGTCTTMMDITGDGLADRVLRDGNSKPYEVFKVQVNNGSGFNHMIDWGLLENEYDGLHWASPQYGSGDTHVDMLDINGDGLPDRVMRKRLDPHNVLRIQYNTGYGFDGKEDWAIQSPSDTMQWNTLYSQSSGSSLTMLIDINGDGLPDRVSREVPSEPDEGWTKFEVQLNTGAGFASPCYFSNLQAEESTGTKYYSPAGNDEYGCKVNIMLDINGDGLVDRVMREKTAHPEVFKVQLNKGPAPDLLKKVTGSLGGLVEVAYKPSTQYDNRDHTGKHRLPFPVQTVSSITMNDGFGDTGITTYEYERGIFDFEQREFKGFGRVTVTDPCGTQSVTYFHQGGGYEDPNYGEYQDANSAAKKGVPYRVEVYGNDENLYSVTINKVEEEEVQEDTGWYFAYVSQTIKMDYEGTGQYRAKVRQSTYDTNTGNILKTSDLGEVINVNVAEHSFTDIDDDSLFIHTTYATFSDPNILNKIESTATTSDSAGNNVLKEIIFDYNDTTGNVIESTERFDINDYITPTTYEYDQYGNRIRTTNAEGYIIQTIYDSNYVMFPVEVNTADFATRATYDARSGLPVTQTDVMGIATRNIYDEFYRLTDAYISKRKLCLSGS